MKNKAQRVIFTILVLSVLVLPGTFHQTSSFGATSASAANYNLKPLGSGVMMQAFYWDVPLDWYSDVNSKVAELSLAGFDNIWLPPPSKTMNGRYSMGYDPYDYYDLGEYDQSGSIPTRFGTKADLLTLIDNAKLNGLHVTADIVLNHNAGGASQWNPNTHSHTWTDFSGVMSQKFLRGYNDFHPSTYEAYDQGVFGGYPDVAHANPYVWQETIDWGLWLRDTIGFTDWRFDYVKGYHPYMVKDWMNHVGGYGVGEYWDSNIGLLQGWIADTAYQSSAFDFALYYTLRDMSEGGGYFDMRALSFAGLAGSDPFHANTFVSNHDTNEIFTMKEMAYAYILMSEGYPTVFWQDYYDYGFKDAINLLINIRTNYVGGTTSVLHASDDLFIMQRNGYGSQPGMILMMNDGDTWKGQWVHTKWSNQVLRDATGRAFDEYANGDGWVEIWAPPRSYTVWIP